MALYLLGNLTENFEYTEKKNPLAASGIFYLVKRLQMTWNVKKIKKKCFSRLLGICVYRYDEIWEFFWKTKGKMFFFIFLYVSSHLQSFEKKQKSASHKRNSACRKRIVFFSVASNTIWERMRRSFYYYLKCKIFFLLFKIFFF